MLCKANLCQEGGDALLALQPLRPLKLALPQQGTFAGELRNV